MWASGGGQAGTERNAVETAHKNLSVAMNGNCYLGNKKGCCCCVIIRVKWQTGIVVHCVFVDVSKNKRKTLPNSRKRGEQMSKRRVESNHCEFGELLKTAVRGVLERAP